MKESAYQSKIIKKLRIMFPGCEILKNDATYLQGVPDITIFYNDRWGMLEFKQSKDSPERPNQSYYVRRFSEMSFAAFIYPENEREVLRELQRAFGVVR